MGLAAGSTTMQPPCVVRRDQVAGSDSAFVVAVQQQSYSYQETQPSTWLWIASLHLAETLRLTALPHVGRRLLGLWFKFMDQN